MALQETAPKSVIAIRTIIGEYLRTARLFPVPCFNTSRPPGPMLLLRDFLRLAANEPPPSVAFSLSMAFRTSVDAPMDCRLRRAAGTVISPSGGILSALRELALVNREA